MPNSLRKFALIYDILTVEASPELLSDSLQVGGIGTSELFPFDLNLKFRLMPLQRRAGG